MTKGHIDIINGTFTYAGKTYDCSHLIKADQMVILREADDTHKDTFDKLYDRNTLNPKDGELLLSENGEIEFILIHYTIRYRVGTVTRSANGNYHRFYAKDNGIVLSPLMYEGRICW